VNRRGPLSMPRAEPVTALPTRQGSTCRESYDFRPFFRVLYPHPANKSSLRVGRGSFGIAVLEAMPVGELADLAKPV